MRWRCGIPYMYVRTGTVPVTMRTTMPAGLVGCMLGTTCYIMCKKRKRRPTAQRTTQTENARNSAHAAADVLPRKKQWREIEKQHNH